MAKPGTSKAVAESALDPAKGESVTPVVTPLPKQTLGRRRLQPYEAEALAEAQRNLHPALLLDRYRDLSKWIIGSSSLLVTLAGLLIARSSQPPRIASIGSGVALLIAVFATVRYSLRVLVPPRYLPKINPAVPEDVMGLFWKSVDAARGNYRRAAGWFQIALVFAIGAVAADRVEDFRQASSVRVGYVLTRDQVATVSVGVTGLRANTPVQLVFSVDSALSPTGLREKAVLVTDEVGRATLSVPLTLDSVATRMWIAVWRNANVKGSPDTVIKLDLHL